MITALLEYLDLFLQIQVAEKWSDPEHVIRI